MRVFNEGGIELQQGDNRQLLRYVKSDSADFVLTDPPYNLGLDYSGEVLSSAKRMDMAKAVKSLSHVKRLAPVPELVLKERALDADRGTVWNDSLTDSKYFEAMRESLWEIRRVLKTGRWFVFTMDPNKSFQWHQMMESLRFVLQGRGVWLKPSQMNGSSAVVQQGVIVPAWEDVLFYTKGEAKFKVKNGKGRLVNVWTEQRPDNVAHPAARPLNMWTDLLQAFSLEDEIVLDPWSGSGTTPLLASVYKRRCLAMELNSNFVQMSIKRVKGAGTRQNRLEV